MIFEVNFKIKLYNIYSKRKIMVVYLFNWRVLLFLPSSSLQKSPPKVGGGWLHLLVLN